MFDIEDYFQWPVRMSHNSKQQEKLSLLNSLNEQGRHRAGKNIYAFYVRGHYQIDVQSCHSRLISPEIFKQLGPYESPEYALSNEVW